MSKIAISAAALTLAALAFCPFVPALEAAGSSSVPTTPSVPKSPEQEAADFYNRGLKLRDKAWGLEEKAQGTTGSQRAKLEKKIDKTWDAAIREFEAATRRDPSLHQAFSSLGYALRKRGSFTESLAAYDRALALAPGYAEAIEYRAEAYLGLNRVDEAKEAYLQLFRSDRARAAELMSAMRSWLDRRAADPAGVEPSVIEDFRRWVEERSELAEQTASLGPERQGSW